MTNSSKKSKKKETPSRSSKEEKLFQNLLKMTEQFVTGKGFKTPLTEDELMSRLGLPPQHLSFFQETLQYLINKNILEMIGDRYARPTIPINLVRGVLHMHPRGFGFLTPENQATNAPDVFIPKHLTKNAVDGDVVEVIINEEVISDKGPEGKVVTILSRARTHLAGIIRFIDNLGQFIVHVPLLGNQQRVIVQPSDERKLILGDRIVMEVKDWGSKETETVCKFSHYLGHISDPSCDITAAIEEFELRLDFPANTIEEALRLGNRVSTREIAMREDFRDLTTFTIDPDTAKDFDDALSLSKDEKGHYHLGVHIADVSHYVKPGTALDFEAQERCNSTYFPRFCLPMLPSALSDNLCSLRANVNRLTVSVLMSFDSDGNMLTHRISRSVIRSAKRFSYREAKQVLDGLKKSEHKEKLDLMVDLCGLLKKKRYERGSIEFSLPELVIVVDEKGMPHTTDYIEYDVTHQMVEEFMLKANEVVAWDLTERGKNLTYRVHDVPAEENLKDFSLLATAFGFNVSDVPSPQDLQKLFEDAHDTPYSNYLASSYIRRMRLAVYSAENIGHYGLSLTHYCHFTSPIRRYVDLVVHRILFGESDDFEYLQQIALRCSEQERISAKAENSVVHLKKLRLLDRMHEENPFREYEAIITRVKPFGVYFEVIELMLEGFLHVSELEEDYFAFDEESMRLNGRRGGSFYAAGNRLTVMLKDVDFISAETKWYLTNNQEIEQPTQTEHQKRSKAKTPPGKKLLKKWSKKSEKKSDKPGKKRNPSKNHKKR